MAYVNVPQDLSKVKNKILFNLTKRQLICLVPTAVLGVALYFLSKPTLGVTAAALVMVLIMVPGFLFALYEKDGMPLEQILRNILRVKLLRPHSRRYETENRYDMTQTEKTKKGAHRFGPRK